MAQDPLETLRKLCLALPETTERLSHGEPTWFIRGKKTFVMYANHHHEERLAFWCAAPDGAQEVLVAEQDNRWRSRSVVTVCESCDDCDCTCAMSEAMRASWPVASSMRLNASARSSRS